MKRNVIRKLPGPVLLVWILAANPAFANGDNTKGSPLISQLTVSPTFSGSTVPANGDVNPYGVAFVPHDFPSGGPLHPGDIIVSNFNNGGNLQGTGTTIVKVNNGTAPTVFFQGPTGL